MATLRQNMGQKMLQKLSPQQIQLMKLLQIPTATLEQRIKEELEANPALEEGESNEDILEATNGNEESYAEQEYKEEAGETEEGASEETFELDEYLEDYLEEDPSYYKLKVDNSSPDEEERSIPAVVQTTFHEYLEEQLGLMELEDEREHQIAMQIIGSIDDDGYLRRDPASISNDLLFSQNIDASQKEIEDMLAKIQRFDPPGIGAFDLQECLALQLKFKLEAVEEEDESDFRYLRLAYRIIEEYFDEFSKKHFDKLQRYLELDEEELREAVGEVLKLNPKPASGYGSSSARNTNYVVPDFIIVNRDGELELSLNTRNAPDLRINDQYLDMLRAYKQSGKRSDKKQKEAVMFIKQKIDSAKWFIDAIRQRQQTMYRSMYAILQYQYDYFLTGDTKRLKPMILKDISDITGLDISTISRVANSKFVQTEFGTKRLKEFFSESIQTQGGEEVSTYEVKKILTEIIAEESKRKPLSDEKLKNILREKGYNIARRTVAKYREQLNIPVARLRKEL
jgi:RNA polymerase sigma-54 factor